MLNNLINWLRGLFHRLFQSEMIRRVVKNSGYLFSATGLSAAFAMLQGILTARLLGVADFGTLGAILVFTSVINKFASFRMGELVVKYVGQYSESGDQQRAAAVFKLAALTELAASLVAFGLIWLLAPVGAVYLAKDASLSGWFVFYGLIVLANIISESSTGLLQIYDRFRWMGIISVLQSFVTLLIITWVYFTQGTMLGILTAYLVGKTVGALGLLLAALTEAGAHWGKNWWRTPLRLIQPKMRELAYFAINTNISASLSLLRKDSELLWVSLLRDNVETGYYKLALTLANLVQMPVSPMTQATYPELSREVARKNWSNVRTVLRQGSYLAGGYTLAATLGLLLFGKPLIRFFYKPEFLPAFPALVILLTGFLVLNTFYWSRSALLAIGLPDYPTKINLVITAVKIGGIFLLVPRFGYLANASLLAGSYIAGVSLSVLKFRSEVKRQEKVLPAEAPRVDL